MDHYVVIGFDEEYLRWGLSSLISLRKLARYQGKIIVAGIELTAATLSKIAELDAEIIGVPRSNCHRGSIFDLIVSLSASREGVFAYWDADVYFQDSIDEVFSQADQKFFATQRQGFLAGPHFQWGHLNKIKKMMSLVGDQPTGNSVFNILIRHYPKLVQPADETWNFVDIPQLKSDDLLTYKGEVVKTIHPSGFIRGFTPNRNILFWERYRELFSEPRVSSRKLISVQHNT
jgi:hypothetical protein